MEQREIAIDPIIMVYDLLELLLLTINFGYAGVDSSPRKEHLGKIAIRIHEIYNISNTKIYKNSSR